MESEGKGKRSPKSVRYQITPHDVRECLSFARDYVERKQHAGHSGWRGGFVPEFTAAGLLVNRALACVVVGKLGEIALCSLAGVAVDFAIHDGSDNGVDVVLPCGTVQVKTSTSQDAVRMVRSPAESADYFVFASLDLKDGLLGRWVYLDGYIKRISVCRCPKQDSCKTDFRGNPVCENFVVATTSLYPIRSLLSIPTYDRCI